MTFRPLAELPIGPRARVYVLESLAAMDHLSLDAGVEQIDDGHQAAIGRLAPRGNALREHTHHVTIRGPL